MKSKAVSGIMLSLLLVSMSTLAFNIQQVKASGTIYIRADGSVDPDTAPILTVDGITYTFTDNIYDSIVVERDNIVVDGAGYTVQGTGSGKGIDLFYRSNVTIKNLEIKTFYDGIRLSLSSNNKILGNNITNNGNDGIFFIHSSNNTIQGNNITNNDEGIELVFSSNNTVSGNMMNGNQYNFDVFGDEPSHYIHTIDVSNLVDGKPVYYLIDKKDLVINPITYPQVGYLALINSINITVEGLTRANDYHGLLLAYTNNSRITNSSITNNRYGITTVASSNNGISGNNITNNFYGIRLRSSSNNGISGNNITNNFYGIRLRSSSNNVLRDNVIAGNRYNFGVLGEKLSHYMNDVDASNTIDGRPIFYLFNEQNLIIDSQTYTNIGYLAVINSTNIVIRHLNMENNLEGVLLAYSKSSIIQNVTVHACIDGIHLDYSSNNSISGSNIIDNDCGIRVDYSSSNNISGNNIVNNRYGMMTVDSSNNKIYHNNFIDNSLQARLFSSIDIWDNGYPSGGNYWSDYAGVDLYNGPYQNETSSDGIGDTPYIIDENNQDNYPLMEPWSLTPPSPVEATQELIETLETLNLPKGTENSLKAKLKVAIHMLDMGKEEGAIHKLSVFINRVEMLREKTLTNEQADYLIAEAQRIRHFING
jgi:parallel beta-helix repeat protein